MGQGRISAVLGFEGADSVRIREMTWRIMGHSNEGHK